jgi:hypothetical protein
MAEHGSLEVNLTSLSPLSFEFVKVGDSVSVRRKIPNKREFRDRIGAASESFLVFKGETKIGMIPIKFSNENRPFLKKTATVTTVDKTKKTLSISF